MEAYRFRQTPALYKSFQANSEHFPFSIWAKLTRELLTNNQQELLTNPPCGGILPLRKAIAGHLKAFRNMNVVPEQIIIGAGTEYLYGLLLKLEQAGVKLSSLSQYYQAPPDSVKHIFIMNYSFVSEDNMEKAVELIYRMLF